MLRKRIVFFYSVQVKMEGIAHSVLVLIEYFVFLRLASCEENLLHY
jgi:hypothetical protein